MIPVIPATREREPSRRCRIYRLSRDGVSCVYNLIMSGRAGAWDAERFDLDRDRLGEYTDDQIKARFAVLDDSTIAALRSLPTLCAYERPLDADARLGRIAQVRTRGSKIRISIQ